MHPRVIIVANYWAVSKLRVEPFLPNAQMGKGIVGRITGVGGGGGGGD